MSANEKQDHSRVKWGCIPLSTKTSEHHPVMARNEASSLPSP